MEHLALDVDLRLDTCQIVANITNCCLFANSHSQELKDARIKSPSHHFKKIMKRLAIASSIAVAAIGAQAQTYAEIGYTSLTAKQNVEGFAVKASPSAIRGILGYELNPNLAIEGMIAMGAGSANVKVDGETVPGVKLKIQNSMGVYLKPKTKLSDNVEIFGRLGFARSKAKVSFDGDSESDSDSSVSYGIGMSYAIDKATSLNVDYMQYLNKDGFKATGFTFGVGYKF